METREKGELDLALVSNAIMYLSPPALPDYQGKHDGKTANNQGNDTDSAVEYDIKQLVQPTVELLRLGFYFRQEFLKPGIYFSQKFLKPGVRLGAGSRRSCSCSGGVIR